MIRYAATLLFAVSAVALGSAGNVSKVNGSITVEPGQVAGDLDTVNGSITVGADARVRDVETVNGAIRLGERAEARSVETVNGSITLAAGGVVQESATAVNGRITLERGARVDGRLENVNGDFRLEGAAVRGGIETVNGDVLVGAGSTVDGGIHIEEPHGWNWRKAKPPRVTIESGAVVNGTLHFEREVDLYVGAGVVLGPVEGVEPRRHALD